ncbi:MAG: pyruvate dehydrogenase (acetyl-transferring) E1 component subunit alpha [Chitinophagales bacterium]|nr:pyruvate dehydrogenase (acetyl-transferring) E1 component subunit alpha [Chitinophagales bacterium]MCO5281100.1 pyruvate dehydrogenase (acetyl-transferring) E1 component subunit alpha [Chitinophagales bacterium]HRP40325.1 pyruvate dehydrogenase (acetyl-transferring) E1 component subunit alpha [Chitinophagales bacterium]
MATKFTKETYLYWYELMLRLRRFEERAGMLYGQQKIRGFCHLYIGQEAVAGGMMTALHAEDRVITAYRDHALAIAKGISSRAAMAELYGKATGCTQGKGGSMHFFSKEHNFFGGHGIVGAQIGLGAGIAFSDQYLDKKNVTICFFGDGAARQGMLHETFNMAMHWKLPVIFVCENNGYAMGTSVERTSNVTHIYKLGEAYNMPSESVDGMKCETVHEAIEKAAERARNGEGPTFLEIRTYRYKGHSMSDPAKYRTKEEVESYKKLDPIETTLEIILKKKWATQKEIDAISAKVDAEMDDCVQFAEESPFPDDSELYNHIYTQQDYPFMTE